ncbi:SurA N-terminal domain-containing protein [Agaribacterium sp. ZY112]|uniref:SurA N-terminal domain-containing protein n=1 Tax=Agaribacterium sp. ZY112 TaxID=3233574 RepID=UPI003523A78F
MLESVRQNLKGTLAVVVVLVFVVPMVFTGIAPSFLGSVAGTDAASVNGQPITNNELQRAIRSQRNRILQQGNVDASSPYLSEESMRGPVLNNLTRRMALVTNGQQDGMGISDKVFAETLLQSPEFLTDGEFDQARYRMLLAQANFTPLTYRDEVAADLIVAQQAAGLAASSFATESEFQQLLKLTHQKRSFYNILIPADKAEADIDISEEELQQFYDENKSAFLVSEKVKVEYLELSVDVIAQSLEVDEADIRAQYEAEVANFQGKDSYEVAHILLETASPERIAEIEQKIAAGESFDALAEEYSDDIATNMEGGKLGVLSPGMFPEAFETAVYELEQDQVSGPVETEAGTHFIKVLSKHTPEVPSFEQRQDQIRSEIASALAIEDFALLNEQLGELTFSSDDLNGAAEQLGLSVESSDWFERSRGLGIASSESVRIEAFDPEVLQNGHNSKVIELDDTRSVVVRIAEHKPSYTQSLDEVKDIVSQQVLVQKQADRLVTLASELQQRIEAGESAEEIAEELAYEYKAYELVKRDHAELNREIAAIAFTSPAPEEGIRFVVEQTPSGSMALVALSEVQQGTEADMEEGEKEAFLAQLSQAYSNLDGSTYEGRAVELADIKLK